MEAAGLFPKWRAYWRYSTMSRMGWSPVGELLFIKSASCLFFQKLMNKAEALLDIFEMNMSNHQKDGRPPPE